MSLLELARMHLEPGVQGLTVTDHKGKVHSLSIASQAVGKALRQVRQDWKNKYPHLPDVQAVVSWADTEHHEGTIYKATNFKEVGKSGGMSHGNSKRSTGGKDQPNPDYLHIKTTFLYEYEGKVRSD